MHQREWIRAHINEVSVHAGGRMHARVGVSFHEKDVSDVACRSAPPQRQLPLLGGRRGKGLHILISVIVFVCCLAPNSVPRRTF